MTPFNKNHFKWDGMYLMYTGKHNLSRNYEEDYPIEKLHPSRIGQPQETFIARFKYGSKPWKSWVNFLCKNFYIEEYLNLAKQTTPRDAIESKGYVDKMTIAGMKATIQVQKEIINTLTKKLEAVK